jgi:hypothetical protein
MNSVERTLLLITIKVPLRFLVSSRGRKLLAVEVPVRRVQVLFPVVAVLFATATAQSQEVRGRVVDEQTRRPVRQVEVLLTGSDGALMDRGVSNDSGFFRLEAKRAGDFVLTAQRNGYAAETRNIRVQEGSDLVVPAFVLRSEAVLLDSLSVRGARTKPDPSPVGFSRSTHLVAGERMAMLEASGVPMLNVFRELPGVRVIQYMTPGGQLVICVESTRRMGSIQSGARRPSCEQMPMVVDGVVLDGESVKPILRSANVQDYESVEYLTPVEAGYRYGLGASSGAIVMWSRGRGPHVSDARNRR